MAKIITSKLPDGLAEAFEERLRVTGRTAYSVIQEMVVEWVQRPLAARKAPPAVPPKGQAPKLLHDALAAVDKLVVNDVPTTDDVFEVRWRDLTFASMGGLAPDRCADLQKIRARMQDEYPNVYCLDAFERGCIAAAREEFQATLPKLTLTKSSGGGERP